MESVQAIVLPLLARSSKDSKHKEVQLLLQEINFSRPFYEGYVYKCKSDPGNRVMTKFNSFNKRYFVLFAGVILYYNHKKEYLEDLKYGLKRYKVLKLKGLYLSYVQNLPPNARFCINLHLPDPFNKRQEILLAFSTRKQKRVWMACLQHQNPNLVRKET